MHHHQNIRRSVRQFGWLFGLGALCFAATGPAEAANNRCGSHEKLVQILDDRYSETSVAYGLSASGQILQVYSSDDGASWTIVATTPQGQSCILATGKYWQTVEPISNDPAA